MTDQKIKSKAERQGLFLVEDKVKKRVVESKLKNEVVENEVKNRVVEGEVKNIVVEGKVKDRVEVEVEVVVKVDNRLVDKGEIRVVKDKVRDRVEGKVKDRVEVEVEVKDKVEW